MSLPVITYTDSLNRVFNLMVDLDTGNTNSQEYGGRIFSAAFHDFSWTKKTHELRYGERLLGFTKEPKEYSVSLLFGGSYDERKKALDLFHSAIEYDVITSKPGTLRWGEFTISCYIMSSKTQPSSMNGYTQNDVTIYCPYPFWQKRRSKTLYVKDLPEQDYTGVKDYPNDYPYNYLSRAVRQDVCNNDSLYSTNWEIIINGYANHPVIQIGNLRIDMNLIIDTGEYLTINNIDKTIILTNSVGRKVNCFGYRNPSSYIFDRIKAGENLITWNGGYSWTLTLIEERSEPRWTS